MMTEEIIEKIKKVPIHYWIFGIILITGMFLRTYHFSDWMVFNPDQARDAQLIENVLDGNQPIPLLGPQSGNTRFALGPIFYYFGIVSGKIFGATPGVFAYPDLLFSILTLPLLFFFLRKYFSIKTTSLVVSILAVSYFTVRYGRFAWNPNSIPFFSILFLYGILGMLEKENKNHIFWPILAGIGLGVGVQLHAVLVLVLPIISFLILGYLWKKNLFQIKSVLLIVSIVGILNVGQIISEVKTGGANTGALFGGVTSQSEADSRFVRNTAFITACQIQSNAHILSSIFSTEECGRGARLFSSNFFQSEQIRKMFPLDILSIVKVLFGIFFSLGGYVLLIRGIRKAQSETKRNFLVLIGIFNVLAFLILIPVASEITMRYFIILLIIPLIFLGLWIEYVEEKLKNGKLITIFLIAFLVALNMSTNIKMAEKLETHTASDARNGIFGEIEPMAVFLLSFDEAKTLYVTGNEDYEKRYYRPLQYLTKKSGLNLIEIRKNTQIMSGERIIYITGKNKKQLTTEDELYGSVFETKKEFNNVVIFVLRKL